MGKNGKNGKNGMIGKREFTCFESLASTLYSKNQNAIQACRSQVAERNNNNTPAADQFGVLADGANFIANEILPQNEFLSKAFATVGQWLSSIMFTIKVMEAGNNAQRELWYEKGLADQLETVARSNHQENRVLLDPRYRMMHDKLIEFQTMPPFRNKQIKWLISGIIGNAIELVKILNWYDNILSAVHQTNQQDNRYFVANESITVLPKAEEFLMQSKEKNEIRPTRRGFVAESINLNNNENNAEKQSQEGDFIQKKHALLVEIQGLEAVRKDLFDQTAERENRIRSLEEKNDKLDQKITESTKNLEIIREQNKVKGEKLKSKQEQFKKVKDEIDQQKRILERDKQECAILENKMRRMKEDEIRFNKKKEQAKNDIIKRKKVLEEEYNKKHDEYKIKAAKIEASNLNKYEKELEAINVEKTKTTNELTELNHTLMKRIKDNENTIESLKNKVKELENSSKTPEKIDMQTNTDELPKKENSDSVLPVEMKLNQPYRMGDDSEKPVVPRVLSKSARNVIKDGDVGNFNYEEKVTTIKDSKTPVTLDALAAEKKDEKIGEKMDNDSKKDVYYDFSKSTIPRRSNADPAHFEDKKDENKEKKDEDTQKKSDFEKETINGVAVVRMTGNLAARLAKAKQRMAAKNAAVNKVEPPAAQK